MLFTKTIQETIHNKFMEKLPLVFNSNEILMRLKECSEETRVIMEFYYGTMPASDIGDYDFSVYKKFADFGLFLAERSQWKNLIPEDIFFNFVLHYRINNESIEDCRTVFYNELNDRISGMNMKEAALEVNIWCAEHVTYRSTDERTASPLTVFRSSYGRCGEESTFAVTAMRSVGIPARQVYTPRWAHCDDNHAWVEVWCDGDWYYLGACEPEPVLNRGWFNNASARAMLVDTKAFLPVAGEEVIAKSGQTLILNELSCYASSVYFTVTVKNMVPVAGVTVNFEILNGSEFFPVASILTDEEGNAGLTLGFGSIHIHAVQNNRFVEAIVDTSDTASVTLDFSQALRSEPEYQQDFEFRAPKDSMRNNVRLNEEQKQQRSCVINGAEQKRKEYAKGFYQEEKTKELAAQFSKPQEVEDILRAAEGNFHEIYDFLSVDFGTADKELQFQSLKCLLQKDYRDIRCGVLAEHFKESLKYQNDYPLEIFVPYIMCPRAYYEEITPYREFILSSLDTHDAELFREKPKRVWEYVSKFRQNSCRNNEQLIGTPEGIIRSQIAGLKGRKVLFVAICRTLGIPARINPLDLAAQYYENGKFINADDNCDEDKENARLILTGGSEKWFYMNNWTMAVLKEGVYQTLELSDYAWEDGQMELLLRPGSYRLITSNRTPNGNQFVKKYCFNLEEDKEKHLGISLRDVEVSNLTMDISFAPFKLYDESNGEISSESVSMGKSAIFVWLEEGHEPTEHILNEFIPAQAVLNKTDCKIIFIIQSNNALSNGTFKKAKMALPGAEIYYSDFSDTAVTMARRMYVDPENLPLTVVVNDGCGIYACSGYNVGIVGLIIKILNLL